MQHAGSGTQLVEELHDIDTRDGDVYIDRLLARGGLPDPGRGGQRPTIGEVRKIDAPPLPSADGIALRGNTLDVARSVNNEITTARLSCDDARAAVVSERTCRGADTTTGVAVGGDRLLVTNSPMDTCLYGDPLNSRVFAVRESAAALTLRR